MNFFFFNYRGVILSIKDSYRFTAMVDLGFDTYRRAMIMVRGIRQWDVRKNQEESQRATACFTHLLEATDRISLSTTKPSTRDIISVKADIGIPCKKKTHLCISFGRGRRPQQTPVVWLDVQSAMNFLEGVNYDLGECEGLLQACQPIKDF